MTMLTVSLASRKLGVSKKTLQRWSEAGFLVPRESVTKTRLYPEKLIDIWVEAIELSKKWDAYIKKITLNHKKLNKILIIKPYKFGDPVEILTDKDVKESTRLFKEKEKLEREFKEIEDRFFAFPRYMQKAILEMEKEKK